MTRLIVRGDNPQAQAFVEYASKLPFVEVDSEKPQPRTFEQAVQECGGTYTVEEFCDGVVELTRKMRNA